MMKANSIKTVLLTFTMMAIAAGSARANTITPLLTGFLGGSEAQYSATVTTAELRSGDGFTIFDFGGYTAVLETPTNWTFGTSLTTSPFGPAIPPDDPTLTNVHFTYNGPSVEYVISPGVYSPFRIGTTASLVIADTYTSRDHLIGTVGNPNDGAQAPANQGSVIVPFVAPAAVPDGGTTMTLLGFTLLAVGTVRRIAGR